MRGFIPEQTNIGLYVRNLKLDRTLKVQKHTHSLAFCLPATSHLLSPVTGASCHGNKLKSESHAYLSALKKVGRESLSFSAGRGIAVETGGGGQGFVGNMTSLQRAH